MKIKGFLFSVAALVALFSVNSATAQEQGEWRGGPKLSVYGRWDGTVGLGAYARYGLSDVLRIEPAVQFLCKQGMSVDISADVHYVFDMDDKLELYPLAGLSLNDPGKFGLGINLGGGASYAVSNKVNLDAGLKWMLETSGVRNPIIFSLGSSFKF